MNRKKNQREYCRETVSRSGPNINPPNRKAAPTVADDHTSRVAANVATHAGTVRRKVIASCVRPLGIKQFYRS